MDNWHRANTPRTVASDRAFGIGVEEMNNEELVRIKAVEVLDGFKVRLTFTDESEKVIDLGVFLRGPVFEPIRSDPELFRAVRVDEEAGTIVWPNGADIDPDVLYLGLKPAWMETEEEALLSK